MTAKSRSTTFLMRAVFIPLLALACLFASVRAPEAGSYQGNGTYTGSPSAAVTAAFAAFPDGGDGLTAALRDLLIGNPALSDDVAYVGSQANAAQQAAAGAAMAQAYTALINRGDNSGAARVVGAAQQSASLTIQTAVTRAVGTTVGANTYQQGGSNTTKASGTTCSTVSPSQSGCQ